MTFEEWVKDTGMPRMHNKDELRAAWHAGFYQGRLHEGAKNIARQIDDEILGHLKAAQEVSDERV